MSAEEENTTATAPPAPKKKPANSYYYWHGHEKERAAVGDIAPLPTPVIVKTDDSNSAEAAAIRALALKAVAGATTVKRYSWADGSKFVTVYISTAGEAAPGTDVLEEDSVHVEYTNASFNVSFQTSTATASAGVPRKKQLSLHLAKRIDPSRCEVRLRPEKQEIQLKLAKAKVPETWYDLVGSAKEDQEDESDEGADTLEEEA